MNIKQFKRKQNKTKYMEGQDLKMQRNFIYTGCGT